ncbi:hypothetical protein PCASD_04169 [Puccinia coronata f. sp. avenae]|uniref:Isochorismatase-like domain-containing protein n=1 Tax=Puccinia coronata f. sp. avenae TaxID=200324 RepID=A0A2N5V7X1_9BASI|nr:hypothetical protein PCASD_04169 [Puccinia coronata f. sp. avenae]
MQERFRTKIAHFQHVEKMSEKLFKVASTLSIPILATEQNPEALGKTVDSLAKYLASQEGTTTTTVAPRIHAKTQFSMLTPEIRSALLAHGPSGTIQVALLGIETHICVLQTSLSLLREGFQVHVVADAVSSCNTQERALALQSIRDEGGNITTSESLIFRILADAKDPRAKEVFSIVKEYSSSTKDALQALCPA